MVVRMRDVLATPGWCWRVSPCFYCCSIDSAFESLLSQNHSSFILTTGCIGVSNYHSDKGSYKIFDSHARDEYGRSHPHSTCVLLEVPSIQGLVQYFQAIHSLGGTQRAAD